MGRMHIDVFIENPAGSTTKHLHDEKTLVLTGMMEVARPYPWPYGFIPGTWAADECCVDCFVLTEQVLRTGQVIPCEVVGLLEQFEDGQVDHNVLAVPAGDASPSLEPVRVRLSAFISRVFTHVPGKRIRVGHLRNAADAAAHIRATLC